MPIFKKKFGPNVLNFHQNFIIDSKWSELSSLKVSIQFEAFTSLFRFWNCQFQLPLIGFFQRCEILQHSIVEKNL